MPASRIEKVAKMGHLTGDDIIRLLSKRVDETKLGEMMFELKDEITNNITHHNGLYQYMKERNASR